MTTRKQMCIPGIIGGLGPLAHTEFERRLIAKNVQRGARKDQEHPIWLLVSATDIPNRSQSLLGVAESCVPMLVKYGHLLSSAGADFLVVTCNTAHAFYQPVQSQLSIPWVHMMDSTTEFIHRSYPHINRVGILATDGTIYSQLYSQSLASVGLTPISPQLDSSLQQLVMKAIYDSEWGIKSTGTEVSWQAISILEEASYWLKEQGAEIAIAGCTELSVGYSRMETVALPWIDPLDLLAANTLDLAYGYRQCETLSESRIDVYLSSII